MRVTALLLADDAIEAGGKLYVHGAGWDRVHLGNVPGTVARMALVLAFEVDYTEALREQRILIDLVDEDDHKHPGVHINGAIKVGHPPGIEPGDPSHVSQAVRIENLTFEHVGGYRFRIFLNDGETALASIPFRITSAAG